MPKHPVHERKYCDTILSTKQSSRSSTRCRVAGTGADESILVTMEMLLPVHYHDDVMSIVRDMFLLILMIVVLDHTGMFIRFAGGAVLSQESGHGGRHHQLLLRLLVLLLLLCFVLRIVSQHFLVDDLMFWHL